MKYTQKTFTVPANSARVLPENCAHGWTDQKGRCVLCGQPSPASTTATLHTLRHGHTRHHIDGLAKP